jgi:ABC-2 type transport system permease protein
MFWEIFTFELKYLFKRPLIYVFFLVFFLSTFGAVSTDSVILGDAVGNVNRNSPYIIFHMLIVISVISLLFVPAFISSSVTRDVELNTGSFFFAAPISKNDYLAGRFGGGLLISFIAVSGAVVGILIAGFMPWLEPERLGPFMPSAYIRAVTLIVLPNIFFAGAISFALATMTRGMSYTYAGIVFIIVIYLAGHSFSGDMGSRFLVSLLDPFGGGAFRHMTQYWTPAERNTLILPFRGSIMLNRSLWTIVSGVLLFFSFSRFRFSDERPLFFKRKKKQIPEEKWRRLSIRKSRFMGVTAERDFSAGTYFKQFMCKTVFDFQGVLKSLPFIVICLIGVINVLAVAFYGNAFYGTNSYPVTRLMLELFDGSFALFLIVVIMIYAGESVWKERRTKVSGIYDAMPTPDWLPLMSKLTSLVLVAVFMLLVCMISLMLFQVLKGYPNLEIMLYFKGLFLHRLPGIVLLCILGIFLHVIAGNKYIGHMLIVAYMVTAVIMAKAFDMEHNLYRFGKVPAVQYSDMNGYGHFVEPLAWFYSYWGLFSILLMVLCLLLWGRGTEKGYRIRLKNMGRRFTKPVAAVTAVAVLGFIICGAYIYYNTNILNEYRSREHGLRYQADYEKSYKHIQHIPQPRITDVKCEVDIYPYERRLDVRGSYVIKNRTTHPIDVINVWISPEMTINHMTIPGSRPVKADHKYGIYAYEFDSPMMPSATLRMSFDLSAVNSGFVNRGSNVRFPVDESPNTRVLFNGTFISNMTFFPHFGYDESLELDDKNDRRKHGLPVKEPMAPVTDVRAGMNPYSPFSAFKDADRISFEATVSTSYDQIAVAPGLLQREWVKDGRRYFHYAAEKPIWNFYSFLSADYEVKRDKWNDVDIEIYYHQKHPYNIERMIHAAKKCLDYFTRNFGPYQHRVLRIVEFPGYDSFAQSFPGTIPYSESVGFIAKVEKEDDIDYVMYMTAHEIAHQWWAHQVMGGVVQGAALMSETLAQYSALMVMEKEYGKDHMRKFLKYELDQYLQGRAGESLKEMPLIRVEDQWYLSYRKGSLVMYALRDYIGEDNLNNALSDYLDAVAYQNPPYTNSLEFMAYLRKATPGPLQYILEDMFETITLYDNRSVDAGYEKTSNGKYRVLLTVETKKIRSDGLGNESEIPISDWIDVGVFSGKPKSKISLGKKVLYLRKHKITKPRTEIEILVNEKPYRAGIDPYNKLIDKIPDDNTKKVTECRTSR